MKRFIAALVLAGTTIVVGADLVSADPPGPPECSPGQHGNPQPGFKPGSCKSPPG